MTSSGCPPIMPWTNGTARPRKGKSVTLPLQATDAAEKPGAASAGVLWGRARVWRVDGPERSHRAWHGSRSGDPRPPRGSGLSAMDCPGREQATCHGKDFSRLTRFFSTGSAERLLPDPERTTGRSVGRTGPRRRAHGAPGFSARESARPYPEADRPGKRGGGGSETHGPASGDA